MLERIKLLTLTTANAAAGATVDLTPGLRAIRRAAHGQCQVLVGLSLDLVVNATTVAATMGGAMTAEQARSFIQQFALKACGHSFISGRNGVDLYLDTLRRLGRALTVGGMDDTTGFADADATAVNVLRQLVLFNQPMGLGGMANVDGAIPLAFFDSDGDGECSFRVGSTADPAFAGVTCTSITGTVHALVRRVPKVRIPTPWMLDVIRTAEPSPAVAIDGAAHYIDLADRADENSAWDTDHVDYTALRVVHDGLVQSRDDQSSIDLAKRYSALEFMHATLPGSADLSFTAPEFVPLLPVPPGTPRAKCPTGVVQVDFKGRASRTVANIRVLHTGVLDIAPKDASKYFVKALYAHGYDANRDGEYTAVRAQDNRKGRGTAKDRVLDAEVYWSPESMARVGYEVAAQRAAGR